MTAPQPPSSIADGSVRDPMTADGASADQPQPSPTDEMTCVPPQGTVCDPVAQCGACDTDEYCSLDSEGTALGCLYKVLAGTSTKGQSCVDSSSCARGLECARTHLCSQYCRTNDDCGAGEQCIEYLSRGNGKRVMGAGACQRLCDPVNNDFCQRDEKCSAGLDGANTEYAVCESTAGIELARAGDSCVGFNTTCEPGYGCSRSGIEVCVKLCRVDGDCPSFRPSCLLQDRLAAPGERIGDCVFSPCDDQTVGEPPPWIAGPVITAVGAQACMHACGNLPSDGKACVGQTECPDKFADCMFKATVACSGAMNGGPCRTEYIAASCGLLADRFNTETAFEECTKKAVACVDQAYRLCVGDLPM